MSKPTLADLPPRYRAQIEQQLRQTPKPRTIAVEPDEPAPVKPKKLKAPLLTFPGLPAPVPEYRFHPTRKWRYDYAWPDHRIALEIDGGIWTGGRHTRGAGYLGDMEKLNAAALLGWRVFRCTPQQAQSLEVAAMIGIAMRTTNNP